MSATPGEPLLAPPRWVLSTWALQVMLTVSLGAVGLISQLAGTGAMITIVAVLTLSAAARSWTSRRSRERAARAMWLGICLAAGLDTYLTARLFLEADRPIAAGAAVLVVLVVAFVSPGL
jgi:predicted deacetylase